MGSRPWDLHHTRAAAEEQVPGGLMGAFRMAGPPLPQVLQPPAIRKERWRPGSFQLGLDDLLNGRGLAITLMSRIAPIKRRSLLPKVYL